LQKREAKKYLNRINIRDKGFHRNDYLTEFVNKRKTIEDKILDMRQSTDEIIKNRTSPPRKIDKIYNSHMKTEVQSKIKDRKIMVARERIY
jgi:hypothetical protein